MNEPCEVALRDALPVIAAYVKDAEVRAREQLAAKASSVEELARVVAAEADLARARWALTATWNAYTWERLEDLSRRTDTEEQAGRFAQIALQASETLVSGGGVVGAPLKQAIEMLGRHCK